MKNNTKLIILLLSVAILLLLLFTNSHLVTNKFLGIAGGTKTVLSLVIMIGALGGFISYCIRYRDMNSGTH